MVTPVLSHRIRVRTKGAPPNRQSWPHRVLPWVVPVLLFVLWQACSSAGIISSATLPPPSQVLAFGADLWASGDLQSDVLVSLRRIAIGFALGAATGLVLGFIVGMSKIAEGLIDRSLQMLRAIPHLALVPLMIAWFGIGEEPKLILVALGVLFPVYLNTVHGFRGVDPKLLQLGQSYGLNRWAVLREVIVPGAMPSILTGIRYALGVAWLTLVVAETIAAKDGIGFLAQNSREQLRNEGIVLAILLYAMAGLLADQITKVFEGRLLRWHPYFGRKASR